MGTLSSTEQQSATNELWSCTCYVCAGDALWEIGLSGEDESVEAAFACELHARGHIHLAIVLPEHLSARPPYSGEGEGREGREAKGRQKP
jgi:hypothetical protein